MQLVQSGEQDGCVNLEARMLEEKTFDTGTAAIHYVECASSGLPLVMLHGIGQRWQTFLSVLPAFALRYHTFALDLRGHGKSARVPGRYRIEDYAADVIDLLREQVSAPAVLAGLSLGGNIAIQVAASAPALVHAVVLEEPAFYFAPKDRFEQHRFYQPLSTLHQFLNTRPPRDALKSQAQHLFPHADQVSVGANAKSWSQADAQTFAQIIDHSTHAHFHLDRLLPQISCPVLLLGGSAEQGAQLEDADVALANALLGHCTHVRVQGAGHNIHQTQPAKYYQLVSQFLESL